MNNQNNRNPQHGSHRKFAQRGFTLVELLVVIAIIAILISMLLPAINAARESARRVTCQANMHQLSSALHNYVQANGSLPSGVTNPTGPVTNLPKGDDMSWITQILPYIGESNLEKHVDHSKSVYDPFHNGTRDFSLSAVACPSSPTWNAGDSSYAGVHHNVEAPIDDDNNGVLFLNSHIKLSDVTDGPAYTLLLGEKMSDHPLADLGWMSGTSATLRNTGTAVNGTGKNPKNKKTRLPSFDDEDYGEPSEEDADEDESSVDGADDDETNVGNNTNDNEATKEAGEEVEAQNQNGATAPAGRTPDAIYVGGFGSAHISGANFIFVDGSLRFLVEGVDPLILQKLGHRADGQLVDMLDVQ